ncbi:diacylglycerol kinase family lipid kinase [Lachnospiraceae bacterium KGMB03038]|nr:diacylglycerol kinase family lipid kinase [Lachnospiraceae bacterium KGMB03038]
MYYFIVNPNARSGKGLRTWKILEQELEKKQVRYQVFFTKYQNHAVSIARELTQKQSCRSLIVLGGDGTLNEAVNGIQDLSKVILGYIPIGSSNDFARSLRLEQDPIKALHEILTPSRYISTDIGILQYQDKRRRFVVSSGIGFDAGVCHQVAVSRLKILLNKIGLGKLSYTAVALGLLLSLTPGRMTLTLDGKESLKFEKVYFAAVMNHPYEGGGFRFCPKADPSDGSLDLIVIAGLPKWKTLLLLPTAFKGWHTHFKGVFTCRFKEAHILSEKALPVHTDGEPVIFQQHITAGLESQKLRLIKTS